MTNLNNIRAVLAKNISIRKVNNATFFKTGSGHYAEHDKFIGVSIPALRKIAKDFKDLNLDEIQSLIASVINEERLLALFILIDQYQNSQRSNKEKLYEFYVTNLKHINNWNLVDASAHLIIGEHLLRSDKDLLITLAKSSVLWERRIAIISTLYFIRNNGFGWTITIAEILLHDSHDLIHKAVGWMLREIGKRDKNILIEFLDRYANLMPRTMLRYAIEKFPDDTRRAYLSLKREKAE